MNVSLIASKDNYKVGFYSKSRLSFMPDLSYKAIQSIGQINRELLTETPNVSVELNVKLSQTLFEKPLVGYDAELYADSILIFSGKVSSISTSQDNITITIES